MSMVIESDPVPLVLDDDGVARVGGSRVKLATVITSFLQNATPEDIVRKFPTLDLGDLYEVIGYYLHHRATVDEYLQQQAQRAEEIRREVEAGQSSDKLKNLLLINRSNGSQ